MKITIYKIYTHTVQNRFQYRNEKYFTNIMNCVLKITEIQENHFLFGRVEEGLQTLFWKNQISIIFENMKRIIKQVDYMLNTAISLPWQNISIKKLMLCNLNFIV